MPFPSFLRTLVAGRRTRREHPEIVASDVSTALWTSMRALIEQQPETFADLGQTYVERLDLATMLARNLYVSGLVGMSARRLHSLVLEEEVRLLIVDYLCRRSRALAERHLIDQLLKRAEYAAYVGTTTTPTGSIVPINSSANLSEVRAVQRDHRARRRAPRVGASRDLRRTRECESRPMPAVHVPARIRGRDAQTDSAESTPLVTHRSRGRLHKTSLVPYPADSSSSSSPSSSA